MDEVASTSVLEDDKPGVFEFYLAGTGADKAAPVPAI